MKHTINVLKAKANSLNPRIRDTDSIKAIVIHYTASDNDTAKGEAHYFATGNTREAGAHYFVDRDGIIYNSVPINHAAWSVGGAKYQSCYTSDGGKYYGVYNNSNTVSIELCGIATRYPSKKQKEALKWLVAYLRSKTGATKIIRHYDVNGKPCPALYCGSATRNKKWIKLKKYLNN